MLQVSPSRFEFCGIAVFADDLADELAGHGVTIRTVRHPPRSSRADLLLIQHHEELLTDDDVRAMCAQVDCPVVLFAHSSGIDGLLDGVHGVLAMSEGLLPVGGPPALYFPHPAWVSERLADRGALRDEFGLPDIGRILGFSGFLKFDRELPALLTDILPTARELGWHVQLLTSPWRLDSPGLLDDLAALADSHPGVLSHVHRHLDKWELNRRLQSCDLLWCWTRAPSQPYASGVASRLYASGTRVVAATKRQHDHILGLPNVRSGGVRRDEFVDTLRAELAGCTGRRHDPLPVSWHHHAGRIADFLRSLS